VFFVTPFARIPNQSTDANKHEALTSEERGGQPGHLHAISRALSADADIASIKQMRTTRSSTTRSNIAVPGPPKMNQRTTAYTTKTRPATTTGTTQKGLTETIELNGGSEETFINVVVRCRGRNKSEVQENSNVVVMTEGVKGKSVELSMGPNALSNKTYSFDQVFSPAADQSMIFDDVVKPILEEVRCHPKTLVDNITDQRKMLAGYNCTIFAYGQTGTGKTHTMLGDMTSSLGILSDAAGIIPRVLQSLFTRLDLSENFVKVSFIELYNEGLRDLISQDEAIKLKIYDNTAKKVHTATVVQGMEEKHIRNADEGIKVLQEANLKRQVAATKYNDFSSRSHTMFTITAYVHRTKDGVNETIQAGKLNLVDLAGSENIQRSGAENKHAAEAGLINKSLLTLGRVINALVDRNPQSHIPYRESKLTRLLQDSLGGRTKTCIIATISPTKSNLEETMSTLHYAFRAKNIRNQPQLNKPVSKRVFLADFANELERLKAELICHRQRNGVYLSNEAYEDITVMSESRRIVLEEHAAKIETLEANLRNKSHEVFTLTTNFLGLKEDNESLRSKLKQTEEAFDQTTLVLSAIRKSLEEEKHLRSSHQQTEEKLAKAGGNLISVLRTAVGDIQGLHAKNERTADLYAQNRLAWNTTQNQISDTTSMVELKISDLRDGQSLHIANISESVRAFVKEEIAKLSLMQGFLDQQFSLISGIGKDLNLNSKDDVNETLKEIATLLAVVKERVRLGLRSVSAATEKTAAIFLNELGTFKNKVRQLLSI
jgi:kinesin family protein 11